MPGQEPSARAQVRAPLPSQAGGAWLHLAAGPARTGLKGSCSKSSAHRGATEPADPGTPVLTSLTPCSRAFSRSSAPVPTSIHLKAGLDKTFPWWWGAKGARATTSPVSTPATVRGTDANEEVGLIQDVQNLPKFTLQWKTIALWVTPRVWKVLMTRSSGLQVAPKRHVVACPRACAWGHAAVTRRI